MSYSHRVHVSVSMGIIRAPEILQTQELSNHVTDWLQVKFNWSIWVSNSMVITVSVPHGHAEGRYKQTWNLNHLPNKGTSEYCVVKRF